MLVLTRKLHQSIFIGDTIRITVLAVREGQVRLGIEAPRDISVLREEVIHAAATSNREACVGRGASEEAVHGVAALLRVCLSRDEGGEEP